MSPLSCSMYLLKDDLSQSSHSFSQILTDQREVGWLQVIFCSSLQCSVSFLQRTASSFIWYQISSLPWLLEVLQTSCFNLRHLLWSCAMCPFLIVPTLLAHTLCSLKILDSPYKICGLEWALEFRCYKKQANKNEQINPRHLGLATEVKHKMLDQWR